LGIRTVLKRESLPYGQVLSIADPVQIRQSLLRQGSRSAVARRSTVSSPSSPSSAAFFNGMRATPARYVFFCSVQEAGRLGVSSSSLAFLLHVHRICVVNSSKNLSIAKVTSRVFTSSGAT
jgi:hypothetical protein